MWKPVHVRPGWLLLIVILFTLPALAQQPVVSFFEKTAGPALTAQQTHYLNVIKGHQQTLRWELIHLNLAALEHNHLSIPLFEGSPLLIEKTRIEQRGYADYIWFGKTPFEAGDMIAVRSNDKISASIRLGTVLYRIYPLGEGLHVLVEESTADFPLDHNPAGYDRIRQRVRPVTFGESIPEPVLPEKNDQPVIAPAEPAAPSARQGARSEDCRIRLLVAYTNNVSSSYADPRGEIELATANMNNAMNNSNVNYKVKLVRVVHVNYNDGGSIFTDLNRFEGTGDGYMDNIHTLRNLYDADMCQLIIDVTNYCGLASGIGSNASTAFCVSKFSCIAGNLTFAHELGHLHGCRHNRQVDNSTTPYLYGHGYYYTPGNWRTIMSYSCSGGCPRVQYWSNPYVTYGGVPMGTTTYEDNHRVLNETYSTVATYQSTVANKSVFASDVIYAKESMDIYGDNSIVTQASNPLDIRNGAVATMRAGSSISMQPGFWARSGSSFHAFLESCNALDLSPAKRAALSEGDGLPSAAGLSVDFSAAPNPFDRSVTVRLALEGPAKVSLAIYDNLGRLMQQVAAEEELASGEHRYQLGAEAWPAGLYHAALLINGELVRRQIIRAE